MKLNDIFTWGARKNIGENIPELGALEQQPVETSMSVPSKWDSVTAIMQDDKAIIDKAYEGFELAEIMNFDALGEFALVISKSDKEDQRALLDSYISKNGMDLNSMLWNAVQRVERLQSFKFQAEYDVRSKTESIEEEIAKYQKAIEVKRRELEELEERLFPKVADLYKLLADTNHKLNEAKNVAEGEIDRLNMVIENLNKKM